MCSTKRARDCFRYYLRSKAAADAIKFTVDQKQLEKKEQADEQKSARSGPEECLSCGA